MPDEIPGQEPQPGGQVPDGQQPTQTPDVPPVKTYGEDDMKSVRNEAASYRTKLRDAEKRLTELEDATKTETQRLQERAERLPQVEQERDALQQRAEAAEAALSEEVDRQKKSLPEEMRDLLPAGSAAEQLGWIAKARKTADKLRPPTLPPSGGRNPAGGGNGKTEPTEAERQAAQQHYASRF